MTAQLFTPMLYVQDSLEAIAFYSAVFDLKESPELTIRANTIPGLDQVPGADRMAVYSLLHFADGSALSVAELSLDDTAKDGQHTVGNNIHVGLGYSDAATQLAAFEKLAVGGEVLVPLEPKPWGNQIYGAVQDRYGVVWESNCYLSV